MAFESLSDKLQNIFKNLRGKGRLTEADVKTALKEVKLALLEADVSFKVVKQFIKAVQERAIGQDVMNGLNPGQMVIKIVNDELVNLMGSETTEIALRPASEVTVIMMAGLQGAGKTTTIRMVCGLMPPTEGTITIHGVDALLHPKEIKKQIGYVPDFFGVYDNLKVSEYMDFYGSMYRMTSREITAVSNDLLELVNLSYKKEVYVDTLSRGMMQRLCVARALIHNPSLLVLDEPNSGLDPRSRKDFQLLLQRLAREDYTILISSHILSELADLCTSIGVINGGVMVQQGKLENIMLAIDSSNPLRITVLNQVPKALELLRQDPQVSRLSVDENKIAAWFSGSREEEAYLLQKLVDAGILVVSFAREHNSLESLFFHLTGETEQKSRNTETFGNTIG